jgi:isocitrate/isopropylmalate dehydrogenase
MSCYARSVRGVPEVIVLSGDGVLPEIVAAARRVVDASSTSSAISWVELDIGECCFARAGQPASDEDLQRLAASRWVLKGPMNNPGERYSSPNRLICGAVGAWANVRFAVHPARRQALDVVLVRDITEDLGMGAQQCSARTPAWPSAPSHAAPARTSADSRSRSPGVAAPVW